MERFNLKKYLSLVLAVLMVLTSTAFAAPAIDAGIEDFAEAAAPAVETAVAEVADLTAGTVIFNFDFTDKTSLTTDDSKDVSTTFSFTDIHETANACLTSNGSAWATIIDGFGQAYGMEIGTFHGQECAKLTYDQPNGSGQYGNDFRIRLGNPVAQAGVYTLSFDVYSTVASSAFNAKIANPGTAGGRMFADTVNVKANEWVTYSRKIYIRDAEAYKIGDHEICDRRDIPEWYIDNIKLTYDGPIFATTDDEKGELLYYFDFGKLGTVSGFTSPYAPTYAYDASWVNKSTSMANMGSSCERSVELFDGDGAFKSVNTGYNQPGVSWGALNASTNAFTKLGTYTAEYDLYLPNDATVSNDFLKIMGFTSGPGSAGIGFPKNIDIPTKGEWNTITSVATTSSVSGAKNAYIGGYMFIDSATNVSTYYADDLKIWYKPATVQFGTAAADDLNDYTTSYTVPAVATAGNVWVSTDCTIVLEGGATVAYADYTAKLQDKVFVEMSEDDAAALIVTSETVSQYLQDTDKGMTTNGVRFEATISSAAHGAVEQYGFQVSATADFATKLTKVVGTVVDGEWNETVYTVDDETGDVTFSVVCYGMEESDTLYVRPYFLSNGTYVYGETVSASYTTAAE